MTDFFIKTIPLPKNRPSGLDYEYQPSTDSTMPFPGPTELTGAFSEGARYTPTSQWLESLYGLPSAFKRVLTNLGEMMNFSSYSGYGAEALAVAERNPWTTVAWLFVGSLLVVVVMRLVWYVMGWKW